jgi:hypothetical protein
MEIVSTATMSPFVVLDFCIRARARSTVLIRWGINQKVILEEVAH